LDVTRNLTPELGHRLQRAVRKHGVSADEYMLRLLEYLPLTTAAMRQAAAFWADEPKLTEAATL